MNEFINWANPSDEDRKAYELFNKVNLYLFSSGYTDGVIRKFYYLCGEKSFLKEQFDELLKLYKKLLRKTNDRRQKFTDSQKRYILNIYDTRGGQSVRRTLQILKKEKIDISERYLYKLIDSRRRENEYCKNI